jgi:hypothetical protein
MTSGERANRTVRLLEDLNAEGCDLHDALEILTVALTNVAFVNGVSKDEVLANVLRKYVFHEKLNSLRMMS